MTDNPAIPAASSTPPAAAHRLSFAYADREDRLVLSVAPGGRPEAEAGYVGLTRRLTGRLIDGFARLLERTSAAAAQAPADMREDIILIEHHGALFTDEREIEHEAAARKAGESGATGAAAGHTATATVPAAAGARLVLLDAVDVAIRPTSFELTLKGEGRKLTSLSVSRAELHRILEALSRHAVAAGWNLAPETAWLAKLALTPDTTSLTLN